MPKCSNCGTRHAPGNCPCYPRNEIYINNENMSDVVVGDLNSDAKGSGARKNGGKAMFSLIPLHLMAGVARVLNGGIYKYKEWNWAKGMAWSVCFDCALRHLFKFWYVREELDKETLEHHLDHAICNILFLKHYLTYYQEGDDRPPEGMFTTEDIDKLFDADDFCKRNQLGPYSGG